MESQASVSIDIYDGQVPSFIEGELESLYGARHACVEYFRVYHGLDGVSTYRAAFDGEPRLILLYQQRHHILWALNQAIRIEPADLQGFAQAMFSRYPRVRRIDLHAVDADGAGYPSQRLLMREDMEGTLPGDVDDYVAGLGKSTRHNIRRYTGRLMRDHPGFELRVVPRAQINSEHLRVLQRLSRERLAGKGQLSTLDETELHRLRQLSARYGLVTLAVIGDRIVGGMLCLVIGKCVNFRIIAHDPEYDDYSLGFLVYFMTICEAIRQGCTKMNFGWGHYPYKLQLGGRRRSLAMLTLYRSRLAYALDAVGLLARRAAQLREQFASGLHSAAASGKPHARFLHALAGSMRRLWQRSAAQP